MAIEEMGHYGSRSGCRLSAARSLEATRMLRWHIRVVGSVLEPIT